MITDNNGNRCEWFLSNLDAYLDQALDAAPSEDMLAHAKDCPECSAQLMFAAQIRDAMLGMDEEISVPLAAQSAWRLGVRAERKAARRRRIIRSVSGVAAALVVLVGTTFAMRMGGYLAPNEQTVVTEAPDGAFASEWSGGPIRYIETPAQAQNAPIAAAKARMLLETDGDIVSEGGSPQYTQSPDAGALDVLPADVKLILSTRLDIETNHFDDEYATIGDLTQEYDGYFSKNSVDTQSSGARVATITARVPSELMEGFAAALHNVGAVVYSERNADDVGGYYFDAQSRLDAQKRIAERLNELITQANATEIESLNAQLMAAYDQIDEIERALRTYDADARYSEVYITLREVAVMPAPSPVPSLGERSKSGVMQSLESIGAFFEDMVVSVAIIAPVALIVLAVCAIVFTAIYVAKKKKKKSNAPKGEGE